MDMDAGIYDEDMLISVVMCSYNARQYIESAVQSVLDQTYKNWELIISDDGSNDGTREWLLQLKDHPQIHLFFQDRNLGYVANKNFAIQQAKGDYITQLDNDDLSDPRRLEKQMEIVKKDPSIKMVACGFTRIDDVGNEIETVGVKEDVQINSFPGGTYPFWFPALLVHKVVYQKVGYFHEYFSGTLGDDLYWTVLANEQFPIYCLAEPLYMYRNNPGSITNNLNTPRKMIMSAVVYELIRQRMQNGTDWLQERRLDLIKDYEESVLANKKFMAEQYRIWAAKAIDKKQFRQASILMTKAICLYPWSEVNFRTLFYFFKQRIL